MPSAVAQATTAKLFLEFSREKLVEECWPRLRTCVESLTDEQVWWRPNDASNSVGNLVLHLSGNVRQWLVTSFKQLQDDRFRPAEFNGRTIIPAATLLEQLGATIQEASDVLSQLTEADLVSHFDVQGYSVTGLAAVYHVIEHFSLHYGQILYLTKLQRGEDLAFYRELNETGRATTGEKY